MGDEGWSVMSPLFRCLWAWQEIQLNFLTATHIPHIFPWNSYRYVLQFVPPKHCILFCVCSNEVLSTCTCTCVLAFSVFVFDSYTVQVHRAWDRLQHMSECQSQYGCLQLYMVQLWQLYLPNSVYSFTAANKVSKPSHRIGECWNFS